MTLQDNVLPPPLPTHTHIIRTTRDEKIRGELEFPWRFSVGVAIAFLSSGFISRYILFTDLDFVLSISRTLKVSRSKISPRV